MTPDRTAKPGRQQSSFDRNDRAGRAAGRWPDGPAGATPPAEPAEPAEFEDVEHQVAGQAQGVGLRM
ncbi:hypothetical protein [Streptomyces sp. NPDC095613]|uniref:hypothetical protein n=1 Tax=Streptomyces sp. NPDC095613 TaxID=3155540 RepID=UPI003329B2F0